MIAAVIVSFCFTGIIINGSTNRLLNSEFADNADSSGGTEIIPNPSNSSLQSAGFDIAIVAAYVGSLATVHSWASASYGAYIKIENHLCHNLIYNGKYVLTHGSWKSHCSNVLGGTKDGCTVTGAMNSGAEGMIQFDVENTGKALNIYFRVSGGWGKDNRIDAFWSTPVSDRDELFQSTNCWYEHCTAKTDTELDCDMWYDSDCTSGKSDYPILSRKGSVEVRYNVGSGNNPDINIELYSNHDDDAQCTPFKSSVTGLNEDELLFPNVTSHSFSSTEINPTFYPSPKPAEFEIATLTAMFRFDSKRHSLNHFIDDIMRVIVESDKDISLESLAVEISPETAPSQYPTPTKGPTQIPATQQINE